MRWSTALLRLPNDWQRLWRHSPRFSGNFNLDSTRPTSRRAWLCTLAINSHEYIQLYIKIYMHELYVHGLFSASVFSCFRFVVHYLVLLSSCFCFAFCNFLHSAINAANGGRPQPQQWQRHHGHASRPQLACCQALFRLQNDLMAAHPLQVGSWGMRAWSIQPVELVPRCLRCSLTPPLPLHPLPACIT